MEFLNFMLNEIRPAVVMSADRFFSMLYSDIADTVTEVAIEAPSAFEATATSMFTGMIWPMIRFFAATGLVAILAYYATRRLTGARGRLRRSNGGGNLELIESVNVAGQAVVQIVKAGEKYLVLGVTKENITMLTEVEQITEAEIIENAPSPFGKIFSRFITPKDETEDIVSDEARNEEKNE
jgi:flagellar biogenesis protein FliO